MKEVRKWLRLTDGHKRVCFCMCVCLLRLLHLQGSALGLGDLSQSRWRLHPVSYPAGLPATDWTLQSILKMENLYLSQPSLQDWAPDKAIIQYKLKPNFQNPNFSIEQPTDSLPH